MNSKPTSAWPRLLLAGALLAAAALAQAQYVWLDDKGLRQYSDRPPPPSVPAKRILKAPGAAQPDAAGAQAPADVDAAPPATKAAPTTAERNADFRKRKTEAAEQEQKAADAARRQADIDSNCASLRQNKQMLDSGRRIGVTDKAGQPGYMSDDERARQTKQVQRSLADCK
ncbi:DUF4124 domain-containing protein [Janthinobacterium fluminis]|uniref:DUF4124 domain-containing protein n=1 Tax=Janthinobacterium fluminis TaxID=2987524 RepID=A0ABT5K5S5_9BURK|nr:DUF4124 domain-containing protein [Janthinobacterium fluminis]MDC8760351.1 DUF4124 domain-containing protein [Janthinobacterium fluminis]